MKLRNKKTGKIGNFCYALTSDLCVSWQKDDGFWDKKEYNSLTGLTDDWEDYEEEPKTDALSMMIITLTNFIENEPDKDEVDLEDCKSMLEKLKAWKRLKDKGFTFYRWNKGSLLKSIPNNIEFACEDTEIWAWEDIQDDLDLLFGGEE